MIDIVTDEHVDEVTEADISGLGVMSDIAPRLGLDLANQGDGFGSLHGKFAELLIDVGAGVVMVSGHLDLIMAGKGLAGPINNATDALFAEDGLPISEMSDDFTGGEAVGMGWHIQEVIGDSVDDSLKDLRGESEPGNQITVHAGRLPLVHLVEIADGVDNLGDHFEGIFS